MNLEKMKKEYINPSVSAVDITGWGSLMKISTKPGGGGPEPGETPLSGAPRHKPF